MLKQIKLKDILLLLARCVLRKIEGLLVIKPKFNRIFDRLISVF